MTVSTQLVSGLSSGLDWRSMIDQLIAIDRKAVDLVESRKTEYEQKLKEWQSFNTKLLSLKAAAEDLKDPEGFALYSPVLTSDTTMNAASLLSVTTSSSASKGSYTIRVDAVAKAQKLSSTSFASVSESLGASYAGDILINGTTITLEATDSLAGLRNKINNANAGTNPTGVSASIVSYAANDNRLILTSDTTGAQGIDLQNGSGLVLEELVAGADASLRIDGVEVTGSDNTVSDVLPGVTVRLLKADANTTITLAIDRDLDGIMEKIESFVSAYNAVAAYIKGQQTYDQEEGRPGGVLFGDSTLSSVKSDLTTSLIQQVWGVSSELSTLGLLGIHVDKVGQLTIDEDKVREFLDTRFNDVKGLFAATGASDTGSLTYLSQSRGTKAGTYAVNITQVATQSTTTSDRVVTDTLGQDQTLTVTCGGKTATVSLTSDMTLSDILHAVNSEMASASIDIVASKDGGDRLLLTHGSYGSKFSFTVEESRDDGLWSGSQTAPVIVDNGLDVAGTINGEAATGFGQILTGDDGQTNVDGLVVEYLGSATGEVGKVTLTLGIAEMFDRALYGITDAYAGYATFKITSLQNSIDGFEERIAEMEARLDQKTERMVNQFVAMELALSRIQSQSQWLQGQISAASSGWAAL